MKISLSSDGAEEFEHIGGRGSTLRTFVQNSPNAHMTDTREARQAHDADLGVLTEEVVQRLSYASDQVGFQIFARSSLSSRAIMHSVNSLFHQEKRPVRGPGQEGRLLTAWDAEFLTKLRMTSPAVVVVVDSSEDLDRTLGFKGEVLDG